MQQNEDLDITTHDFHSQQCGDGWDVSLFVDPIAADWICGICHQVARNIIETHCGHIFCHCCLLTWIENSTLRQRVPTCPMDNLPIKWSSCHVLVKDQRKIWDAPIRCAEESCGKVMQLRQYSSHQQTQCSERHMTCDLCGVTLPRSQLHKHLEEQLVEHFTKLTTQIKQLDEQVQHLQAENQALRALKLQEEGKIHVGKLNCRCAHTRNLIEATDEEWLYPHAIHLNGSCVWTCCAKNWDTRSCRDLLN